MLSGAVGAVMDVGLSVMQDECHAVRQSYASCTACGVYVHVHTHVHVHVHVHVHSKAASNALIKSLQRRDFGSSSA